MIATTAARRVRRRWQLVAGVAVVCVVAAVLWAGRESGPDVDVPKVSAAQSRTALEAVLAQTAPLLAVTMEAQPAPEGTLTCSSPAVGDGVSYELHSLVGPAVADMAGVIAVVRAQWIQLGFAVSDRSVGGGEAKGLLGMAADGGSIYMLTGPGGTTLAGESVCSKVAGAPAPTQRT